MNVVNLPKLCDHCGCKLDELSHQYGEDIICDDCFDEAMDVEMPDE